MGYAKKVCKVSINGTMFGGLEHWSTGFYLGATGADAVAPTDAFMAILASSWKTFFTAASSKIGLDYSTTSYRAALMGTDGKAIPGAINNFYEGTPYTGAGGPAKLPPQCALVATLTTATPRGLGSKGRMYLPGISASVGSDGHIQPTDTLAIATNLRNFLAALNASVEHPGTVITASQGSKAPLVGAPVNRVVSGVKVGNVYDTQRRRRNELVESYSFSPAL